MIFPFCASRLHFSVVYRLTSNFAIRLSALFDACVCVCACVKGALALTFKFSRDDKNAFVVIVVVRICCQLFNSCHFQFTPVHTLTLCALPFISVGRSPPVRMVYRWTLVHFKNSIQIEWHPIPIYGLKVNYTADDYNLYKSFIEINSLIKASINAKPNKSTVYSVEHDVRAILMDSNISSGVEQPATSAHSFYIFVWISFHLVLARIDAMTVRRCARTPDDCVMRRAFTYIIIMCEIVNCRSAKLKYT